MAIHYMPVRKTNTFSASSPNSGTLNFLPTSHSSPLSPTNHQHLLTTPLIATSTQPPSLSLYTHHAGGGNLDPDSAGASSRGSSVSPIDGHKPQVVVVHKPSGGSGAYDDAEPSTADAWKVGTRK